MSRLESQTACSPLHCPITHPVSASLASSDAKLKHRKGWLMVGGGGQCPGYLPLARSRCKHSSGSLRTVHLPPSPGSPAFCSQGQGQRIQTWRVSDRRGPSRSSRTTPIKPLTSKSAGVLSCFSHVRLFATPWTVACQALLSRDSPGKSTGVGCHALLQLQSSSACFDCFTFFICQQLGEAGTTYPHSAAGETETQNGGVSYTAINWQSQDKHLVGVPRISIANISLHGLPEPQYCWLLNSFPFLPTHPWASAYMSSDGCSLPACVFDHSYTHRAPTRPWALH